MPSATGRVVIASWRERLSRDRVLIAALILFALAVRVAYVLGTRKFLPSIDGRSYNELGAGLAVVTLQRFGRTCVLAAPTSRDLVLALAAAPIREQAA